jgi:hypothetical protein
VALTEIMRPARRTMVTDIYYLGDVLAANCRLRLSYTIL